MEQFGWFFLVGVVCTLVDFLYYNVLSPQPGIWPKLRANCISTTIGMAVSYTLNGMLVFSAPGGLSIDQVPKFLVVTCFSCYVLQNLIILSFTRASIIRACVMRLLMSFGGGCKSLSEDMLSKNAAKAFGVLCGLLWNFFWYKYYVYVR